MKYTFKSPSDKPSENSIRYIRKFIFLPKILNYLEFGPMQLRWLEYAEIKQIYQYKWIDLVWSDHYKESIGDQ